jgi:hypothetical protein
MSVASCQLFTERIAQALEFGKLRAGAPPVGFREFHDLAQHFAF